MARTVEQGFVLWRRAGRARHLAAVFDGTAPVLLALARSLQTPGVEPEDLVHETFVTAIDQKDRYQEGRPLLPWLCGILTMHGRRHRRRARRSPAETLVDPATVAENPARQAEAADLQRRIEAALAGIADPYRVVLRLHLIQGLDGGEIASALERKPATVRTQLARGLAMLRRRLADALPVPALVWFVPGSRRLASVRRAVLAEGGGVVAAESALWIAGGVMGSKVFWGAAVAVVALTLVVTRPFAHEAAPVGAGSIEAGPVAAAIDPPVTVEESGAAGAGIPTERRPEPANPGPTIAVRVVTPEGTPVAGAEVFTQDPEALREHF